MWDRIKQFLAPPIFDGEEDKTRTARYLNTLLWLVIVSSLGIIAPLLPFFDTPWLPFAILLSFLFVFGGLVALMHSGRVQAASWLYAMVNWLIGAVLMVLSGGLSSSAIGLLFTSMLIAGLLLGNRGVVRVATLSVIYIAVIAVVQGLGLLPEAIILFPVSIRPKIIAQQFALIEVCIVLSAVLFYFTYSSLVEFLGLARRSAAEAEAQKVQVQALFDTQIAESARRKAYLGATTAIAREVASAEHDPGALLNQLAGVINNQFGFYHTGIYVIDEQDETVSLQAASGHGAERMVAQGYRIRMGEGIIGEVSQSGLSRLAQDVDLDTFFMPQDELPDTRSKLVLPLRVHEETIGVLDVQSRQADAFSGEGVTVLQTLADQIAVAITNFRLFSQLERSLEIERRVSGELTQEAWQKILSSQAILGFLGDAQGIVPVDDVWEPQMRQAALTGQVVSGVDEESSHLLAIPIRVRDDVVGVIDGSKPDGTAWTADEIQLLETLTEQLGVALDSARLYQDTQRRAAREGVIREISDEMQRATDMDSLLRITAEALNQALRSSRVYVHMGEPGAQSSDQKS